MTTAVNASHWVIEWTSEFIRKWWTGREWSEDFSQAKWYNEPPDAPALTLQEGAHAVQYDRTTGESG